MGKSQKKKVLVRGRGFGIRYEVDVDRLYQFLILQKIMNCFNYTSLSFVVLLNNSHSKAEQDTLPHYRVLQRDNWI